MRFKPPPPDKDIGWRVEFSINGNSDDDFGECAFCIFIVLVTRAILSFDLNFISQYANTENMETAHARTPFSRRSFISERILSHLDHHDSHTCITVEPNHPLAVLLQQSALPIAPLGPVDSEYALMSISDIITDLQMDVPRSHSIGGIILEQRQR